jgi:hypothetical protein
MKFCIASLQNDLRNVVEFVNSEDERDHGNTLVLDRAIP